jgi:hypothetical protein
MAGKKVYEERTYALMDGTEVTVRPLPIKALRTFMETWSQMEKFDKEATEVDLVNVFFECAYIVVSQFNEDVTMEQLEESLDMKTMEQILELGGGIQTGGDDSKKRG